MADEHDLVLAQRFDQQRRELDAVLHQAIDGDRLRRRAAVLAERPGGAALIPLHDGEVLQPQPESRVPPRVGGVARTAVQKQQHRVVAILAANRDPLLDAAHLDVLRLVDPVGRRDRVVAGVSRAHELEHRFELLAVGTGRGLCLSRSHWR